MAMFPVILCGGAGTRLWPASRPDRPKQFIDLTSDRSLFQETVARVSPLVGSAGRLVVVAGAVHRGLIADQLAAIGVEAVILLEPEGRDSAAAMAAAAAWIVRHDPEGVALFVASDHHIPDGEAFRAAAIEGAAAARAGRIVTFGVRPTEPSSAYGYIQPEGPGLSAVRAFVEKPDRARASRYMADGYLWNSGNFVTEARVLLAEMAELAPAVASATAAAVPVGTQTVIVLSDVFRTAPKISIDYAVMEKSRSVSVLPVDFVWSDLGAWDAVAATGGGDRGLWVGEDEGCLVRAAEGMVVATVGLSRLAIIAEPDAVLVCSLDRAQEVKGLVERLGQVSPRHLRAPMVPVETLSARAARFGRWIRLAALPLWATLGIDTDGGFAEALDRDGQSHGDFRRARVQARQAFVYSAAGLDGWTGPWRSLVSRGLDRFDKTHLHPDGLYRTTSTRDGRPLDDTVSLYDQAFALFAFAAAAQAGVEPERMKARASRVLRALEILRSDRGGWREAGPHPYQANAQMHLLEACLAWEALDPDGGWSDIADAVVALARRAFIAPQSGALREFFDADWQPAAGEDGRLIEPGHQFEWAWLLTRWGRRRNDDWAASAAARLHAVGLRGTDPGRGVAFDAMNDDLSARSTSARLWPQTERLKAALILAETAEGPAQDRLLDEAGRALAGLQLYLDDHGLWRDRLAPDGQWVDEPAPASSFYHIMAAWQQLRTTAARLPHALGDLGPTGA